MVESARSATRRGASGARWDRIAGLFLLTLAAAATPLAAGAGPVEAVQAREEIPEELLLDVGIQILDPGVPETLGAGAPEDGVLPEVRRSEARYIPVRLMHTLQATGNWGAVRVVPAGIDSADVLVTGTILESRPSKLVLDLRAIDSSGRIWFERRYKRQADPLAYADDLEDIVRRPPFQDLYNEVANDLLAARDKLKEEHLRELRAISELHFAADLLPAYADYLGRDRKGRLEVARLPAEDDPMMERIARIRERDQLFIDTLSEHYATFQARMEQPYSDWRQLGYEEEMAKRRLKRTARARKIIGIVAILGGLMSDDRRVANAGVMGGIVALQSGIGKAQEAKIHIEALRELAASLDAEMSPLLVDVEGQTLRLTGTAETQYMTWRQLLRDLFLHETGFSVDPDTGLPRPSVAAGGLPETLPGAVTVEAPEGAEAPESPEAPADAEGPEETEPPEPAASADEEAGAGNG